VSTPGETADGGSEGLARPPDRTRPLSEANPADAIGRAESQRTAASPSSPPGSGHALMRFVRGCPGTAMYDLQQSGCMQIRVSEAPDAPDARYHHIPAEAVLINAGADRTGSGHVNIEAHSARGTRGVITTQRSEVIQTADDAQARLTVAARLAHDADLHWIPQPRVLLDGSALTRTMSFDLEAGARLFAVESTVFGDPTADTAPRRCRLTERWRIWRDEKLLWAAEQRVTDPQAQFALPSTLADGRAVATLVYAADDAPAKLDAMRSLLGECRSRAGASAVPGVLIAMMVAQEPGCLRADLEQVIEGFTARGLPHAWRG
jgi:urease accessory protein UreH